MLRGAVEVFRGDLERGTIHGLLAANGFDTLAAAIPTAAWYNISTSQFISLCMAALGLWILVRNLRALPPPADLPAPTRLA
jgi:phosphatidylglycerol:prolipoprotein diacylglycerol transferase